MNRIFSGPLRSHSRSLLFAGAALSLLGFGSLGAAEKELIKNGDFKRGADQWNSFSSQPAVAGFFALKPGDLTPLGYVPSPRNRRGGNRAMVSDQTDPSAMILSQKFRVPRKFRRVTLAYQLSVQSFEPPVFNPAGLDATVSPNQHARVDLLTGNAPVLSVNQGVVARFYTRGTDTVGGLVPAPYRNYRFNLTRKVRAGQSYRLRFGLVVTEGPLIMAVDNVSVKVE